MKKINNFSINFDRDTDGVWTANCQFAFDNEFLVHSPVSQYRAFSILMETLKNFGYDTNTLTYVGNI
jgi:hypothetical protein